MFYALPALSSPSAQGEDPKAKADELYQEGMTLFQKADYPEAIKRFEAALSIYQDIGARVDEGTTLNAIGSTYRRMGQYMQALQFFRQALAIWQDIGHREGEGITLNNIGLVYTGLGQYPQALDYLQQALVIKQETGDEISIGKTLNNIGEIYLNLGQYSQALEYFRQALTVQQKVRDPVLDGAILNNSGTAYRGLGQYAEALKSLSLALEIAQKTGDKAEEGIVLNNIGEVYRTLGKYPQALEYYQHALEISKQTGDQPGEATRLANIGELYLRQGQYILALGYLRAALEISHKIGQRMREETTLGNIGYFYRAMGDYSQALDYYQQALTLAKEIGDRMGEASTLNNIGEMYISLKQYPQALESLSQALARAQEIGDRTQEEMTLGNIGFLYEQQGDTTQAIDSYQQSIKVTESIQNQIQIDELKASFLEEQTGTYEHLIGLLWDEGRFPEAFNFAERARARTFLDQLAGGTVDFRAGANAALLEQERALKSELVSLRAQLLNLRNRPQSEWDIQSIDAIQTKLTTRENDYVQLLTEIKIQSPEIASLISVEVASLADTQSLLDTDTTLIEYFVASDRTLAFIITHDTFQTVTIDVRQDNLAKTINTFRDFASLNNPHPASLKQLYAWLITPLKDSLDTSVVGIIPHGILHYLPFAALTDGAQYLGDQYSLFTLPSSSTLGFIQEKRKSTSNTILAFGNPTTTEPGLAPLDFAQQEVETITKIFGARPFIAELATESALRSKARNAGIVHLAAHGQFDSVNPLFSAIFLAQDKQEDGRLEVHEIYGLDLTKTTDLVVLSACQTDIGAVSAGDEVVGLTRAFLYAGTPTVVASLWNVDDKATTLLMDRFYTHLREGMGKAQALQKAQKEVRAQYPNPYYWAAFVLTGDPGSSVQVNPVQSTLKNNRLILAVALSTLLVLFAIGAIVMRRHRRIAEG